MPASVGFCFWGSILLRIILGMSSVAGAFLRCEDCLWNRAGSVAEKYEDGWARVALWR